MVKKIAGAALMMLGVLLLLSVVVHFNDPPELVPDSALTPNSYYIGHTRLQGDFVFGVMSLGFGWLLFTRDSRLGR